MPVLSTIHFEPSNLTRFTIWERRATCALASMCRNIPQRLQVSVACVFSRRFASRGLRANSIRPRLRNYTVKSLRHRKERRHLFIRVARTLAPRPLPIISRSITEKVTAPLLQTEFYLIMNHHDVAQHSSRV